MSPLYEVGSGYVWVLVPKASISAGDVTVTVPDGSFTSAAKQR